MKRLNKTLFRKIFCAVTVITVMLVLVLMIRSIPISSKGYESKQIPVIAYNTADETSITMEISQIEQDIEYLTNKGYTPVFASEAAHYLEGTGDMPEKPIMLTFDGGLRQYCTELLPILKKYRFKAVISVSGKQTELASNSADDNSSFLRWDQIKELNDSGLAEISNGTFSYMANNEFAQKRGESYEDYRNRIIADIGRLQDLLAENCGFEASVFTYPCEKFSESSVRLVKNMGFCAGLCIGEDTVNSFDGYLCDPHKMPRIKRSDSDDLEKML